MKKTAALLFMMFFSLFAAEKALYVNSAARPLERDWHLTSGDIAMEQVAWPNGESGLTAKFTYSAHPDGWPSAKFFIPEGQRDWRSAKKLIIEIYATRQGNVGLAVATYNDQKTMSWYNLAFEPGRHTIEVNLEDMKNWDMSNVKYIDIYSSRPTESYSLYVGDIQLDVIDPALEAAMLKNDAAVAKRALDWRLKALSPNVPDACTELAKHAEALPEIPKRDELIAFRNSCRDAFPQLDRTLFERAANSNGFSALWCAPEEKVLRDVYAFLSPCVETYVIEAGRGEGESAQLVALAKHSQNAVQAQLVSAPVMADGTVIPLESIKLSPIGYAKTSNPQYRVDYVGYWPDPILEYLQTPIPMEAERYQSWWLDVKVPHGQKSGPYKGQIRFVYDQGEYRRDYTIRVHSFELADGVQYPSPVDFNPMPQYPADPAENAEYRKKIASLLIEHRLEADRIYHSVAREELVDESKWLLDNGALCFNMGLIYKEVDDAFYAEIAEAYRKCKEAGLLDKAFIYCFDECPASMFPMIKKALSRVREAAPGVPIATTLYDSTFGLSSGLDDLIDIWLPLTTVYAQNQEYIEKARERGKKVGWYVCCTPWEPYANFLLEYPGTGARLLMGFMNRKFKPDFFLYYSSCMWRIWQQNEKGEYSIKEMINTPVTGGPFLEAPWLGEAFRNFPGDGRLLYPASDGPIPTQRLKLIRDGVDDWMYIGLLEECLKDAQKMSAEWQARAKAEMEIENELVQSMTEWTKEPALLQAKRARIAELLDEFFTTK